MTAARPVQAMQREFPLHVPFALHLGWEPWGFGDGQATATFKVLRALPGRERTLKPLRSKP